MQTLQTSKKIFSIQGNIGSGKSTFLSLLSSSLPSLRVIPQPVKEWQMIRGRYNLLDMYYRDPKRWSFTFQINAVLSRMKQLKDVIEGGNGDRLEKIGQQNWNSISNNLENYHKSDGNKPNSQEILFSERSVVADKQIFAKLLHKQNTMTDMQFQLYLKMYESLDELFKTPRVHKFIYLRTVPQKSLERIQKRARPEEKEISLDYLKKIHQLHQNWLHKDNPNVLRVCAMEQFQNNKQKTQEMVAKVRKFILE